MNLKEERYIILEIIPTKVKDGDIAQLSALKINGIKLEDRFDYRLDKNKIKLNYNIKRKIKKLMYKIKYRI